MKVKPMNALQKKVHANRPQWSNSTIHTYYSGIRQTKGFLDNMDKPDVLSLQWLAEPLTREMVITHIKTIDKINARLNRVQSIVAYMEALAYSSEVVSPYKAYLKELNAEYKTYLKNNKKSHKMNKPKSWLEYDKFIEIVDSLTTEVQRRQLMIQPPNELDDREIDLLQQIILLRLISLIPLSLCQLIALNIDDFDNGDTLILNLIVHGKGKNTTRKIIMTNGLKQLIDFWFNLLKLYKETDDTTLKAPMFIHPKTKQRLTPKELSRQINKVFLRHAAGKKISVNMLRQMVIEKALGKDINLYQRYRMGNKIMRKKIVPLN